MIDIIALKILGIVLLAVLIVIISLLFIPINLYVKIDEKFDYLFKIKFLFFKFSFDNKKEKKPAKKPDKQKNNKERKEKKEGFGIKAIKKLFGIDSFQTKNAKGKKKATTDNAKQIINTLKSYLSALKPLLKTVKMKKLNLKSVSAGDDAAATAVQYGVMCALLYPFSSFLKSSMNIDENAVSINVICGFESDKSQFEIESEISIRLIFAFIAIVSIIRKNI